MRAKKWNLLILVVSLLLISGCDNNASSEEKIKELDGEIEQLTKILDEKTAEVKSIKESQISSEENSQTDEIDADLAGQIYNLHTGNPDEWERMLDVFQTDSEALFELDSLTHVGNYKLQQGSVTTKVKRKGELALIITSSTKPASQEVDYTASIINLSDNEVLLRLENK